MGKKHIDDGQDSGQIPTMADWRKKLRAEIERQGRDMKAVSLSAGLGATYVRDALERGRGGKVAQLQKLAVALGRPPDWLTSSLRDEGNPDDRITRVPLGHEFGPPDATEVAGRESGVSSIAPYRGTLPNAIPDLEAGGGAGPGEQSQVVSTADNRGVTYAADAVRGEIVLPQYLLSEYTRTAASRIHSIRVKGDSMETTLSSGDRVFADTNDTAIGQGGVFVILDHRFDEVLIKRLKRVGRGEKLLIRSDNPKQGDDEVASGEITIIGRAVARLTRI